MAVSIRKEPPPAVGIGTDPPILWPTALLERHFAATPRARLTQGVEEQAVRAIILRLTGSRLGPFVAASLKAFIGALSEVLPPERCLLGLQFFKCHGSQDTVGRTILSFLVATVTVTRSTIPDASY